MIGEGGLKLSGGENNACPLHRFIAAPQAADLDEATSALLLIH